MECRRDSQRTLASVGASKTLTCGPHCCRRHRPANVLPKMLMHFLPSGAPVREFKPVYLSLAYVLALDESINADDLVALATLAEAVLECAPIVSPQSGTNEFQELLDTLEAGWNHVAAPRHIDWALHILDLLISFNVNAHAPIDSFLQQVINGFRAWARRIRSINGIF